MKVRIASTLLVAASLYAFLGICPMQVSLMDGQDGGMKTMQHAMAAEMDETHGAGAPCSTCAMAIEQFAFRESETLQKAGAVVLEVPTGIPLQNSFALERTTHRFYAAKEGNSPPLFLASIHTIVLRT